MSTQAGGHEADIDTRVVAAVPPVGPRPGRRRRRRRGVVLGLLAALALLTLGLYLLAYLATGDRLPRNTVIAGVAVGGLDRQTAIDRVTAAVAPVASRPLRYTAAGKPGEVDPAAAGLTVDVAGSVDAAGGGRSLDPRVIWHVLTGGSSTGVRVRTDEPRLAAATQTIATAVNRDPANATLTLEDGAVRTSAGTEGITVQEEPAAEALRSAFLGPDRPVPLPVTVTAPEITTAEVDDLARRFAEPATSGPVRVSVGSAGTFAVTPRMIARSLDFVPTAGTLQPRLDPERLRRAADDAVDRLNLRRPRDATVRLEDGKPVVVPATNGTTVTAEALARAVQPALTRTGAARTVSLNLTGRPAKFSTADAEKLRIREVTGEFTTRFPYATYRNVNIGRAAEKINGTLVKPGEVFSLNRVVGERTAANGFVEGYTIQNGDLKKDLGGGVSQSATTTYNAAFFAGLEDVEHKPHSVWFDRYPAGREATVAWPTLDMRFRNDTRYGVLVQAFTRDSAPGRRGSITVRIWSTKTYDKVTATEPQKSNFTTGRDLTRGGPDCEAQAPLPGFDVRFSRVFTDDGRVVKRERYFWRYNPLDRIRCS